MTLWLNIITLLLALPFQMASFTRTMVHISEHHDADYRAEYAEHSRHKHSVDHEHPDHSHPGILSEADALDAKDAQRSEGEPEHSHFEELSGALVQGSVPRSSSILVLERPFTHRRPIFEIPHSESRVIDLLVFRPPIFV